MSIESDEDLPVDNSEGSAITRLHETISGLERRSVWIVAALLGAFANLGFAPIHFWPAPLISIIGWIWLLDGAALQKNRLKSAFARGLAWGAGFFLVGMHWMVFPFLVNPEKHLIFIWMPLIAMPLGLGLFPALASWLSAWFWTPSPSRIFVFSFCFTLAEALRGSLFGGFPWNWLGSVWEAGGGISQIASIIGLWGLTILTIFAFSSPAAIADKRPGGGVASRVMPSFIAVAMFAFLWGWGAQRVAIDTEFTSASVRLVDVGIPQNAKWEPENQAELLRRFLTLTGPDLQDEPRLVIWPEGALPYYLFEAPNALDAIVQTLGDRHLIVGGAHRLNGRPPSYNALFVLDGKSQIQTHKAIYYKHRLVPFGELSASKILPLGEQLQDFLPVSLQRITSAGFEPGIAPGPIEVADMPIFLPLICYEALFPQLSRNPDPEVEVLINISVDSWFGAGVGPAQHYNQARYRSIETGLPMARVASRGVTAIVDGYGRTSARATRELDKNGWNNAVLDSQLPARTVNSTLGFASRWISLGLQVLLLVSAFFFIRR